MASGSKPTVDNYITAHYIRGEVAQVGRAVLQACSELWLTAPKSGSYVSAQVRNASDPIETCIPAF